MNIVDKSKIIVCASIAYMEDRVRLSKLKEVFSRNKIIFQFWGWKRLDNHSSTEYIVKHLWTGGGFSNKMLFLHYPIWILMVFFHSLKLSKKDHVYAVALDVAVPIYLGSLIKGYTFIFDNPDNFSLTYNLKGFTKWFIDKIEAHIAYKALYHILPVDSRFKHVHENILIAPNFPLKSEIEKAKTIYKSKRIVNFNLDIIAKDPRLKLYINGRMVYHRGSEWLADVFKQLDPEKFLIIAAGDIYCDKLKNRIEHSNNVFTFPTLDNDKALSLYYCSDLVIAFYDPILPINRKAAPNKWWDCVACQVPFVSNIEIETLSVFKEKDACFTVPYGDSNALLELFNRLSYKSQDLVKVKENLKLLDIYSWEFEMKPLIENLKNR